MIYSLWHFVNLIWKFENFNWYLGNLILADTSMSHVKLVVKVPGTPGCQCKSGKLVQVLYGIPITLVTSWKNCNFYRTITHLFFDREIQFDRPRQYHRLSFLYVCMVNAIYLLSFVETPRKFIIAELSIRKLGFLVLMKIRANGSKALL